MNACSPRGHNFVPIRQFGQRFSFIRDLDPQEWESHPSAFDREKVLSDALAYSRLIRDNAFSMQYAARIVDFADGERVIVYSGALESRHVYRVRQDRDWLDYDEAGELRDLLAKYWSVKEFPRA